MKSTIEIKDNPILTARPCPFCGSRNIGAVLPRVDWDEKEAKLVYYHAIVCRDCKARGPIRTASTSDDIPEIMERIVDAWGREKA